MCSYRKKRAGRGVRTFADIIPHSAVSHFPSEVARKTNFREERPSQIWQNTLGKINDIDGSSKFIHIAQCDIFTGASKVPYTNEINPILLPYAFRYCPELVREVEGNYYLETNYNYTTPYPLGEYNSMTRFGEILKEPVCPYFDIAWNMVAEAFRPMADSPPLDLESSFHWFDRTKSPGWPWQLVFSSKGELADSGCYRSFYNHFEKTVIEGGFYPCFFRPFVKRELKKKENIREHLPRTVVAAPMEHTQLGYRMYAPMNECIMKPFLTPCWVGNTKFGGFWNELAKKLLFFPNVGDGDCTRFDGTVGPWSFKKLSALRKSCSRSDFGHAHDFYYDACLNTIIVGCEGDVYRKRQGQPSGQANTSIDNSLVHCSYWFYHWCKNVVPHFPDLNMTWSSFQKHVCLIVNGDDVVYSYSNHVKKFMCPSAIRVGFRELGIHFKFTKDFPTIDEIEFCSMTFKLVEGFYMPVPKQKKMLASIFLKRTANCRILLKRLLAIRIEVWWDDWLRSLVNSIISDLRTDHLFDLNSPPTMRDGDDSNLKDINSLDLSPFVINNKYRFDLV